MRWLVLSPYLPHPSIGHGGGISVYHLCRALTAEHEVTLLCFRRHGEKGLESHLRDRGVRVETVDFLSEHDRGLARVRLGLDRLRCQWSSRRRFEPFMVTKYRRRAMAARLRELVVELSPDVLQVEYGFMAPYAGSTRQDRRDGRPHVLLNTHELVTLARLRELASGSQGRGRAARELSTWSVHESRVPASADTVVCVTEQDRLLLHAISGAGNLRTIPLGVALDELRPRAEEDETATPRLLFVGSFAHPPNVDGARCLLEEILPRVWESRPDLEVDVVGANPPEEVRSAAQDDESRIHLHGFVEDLDPLFDRSTLFVAPLWSGGGIKIKVLEAMGRGAAVVTTPIGAEGIDEAGDSVAIAPDPVRFAGVILDLLEDRPRRDFLSSRAREKMADRFSWAAIVRELARAAREGAHR